MGKQLVASMNHLPAISGSSASLEAYISAAHAIPILSFEQEQAYARELQETGDINAAQQLILPHLRFVIKIANNYSGYGLSVADLIQEGNIGLMKAVKRFDPDVGVRLVSFAVHWIKAEMHEYILKNWRIVKIATTKAQRKLFFKLRSQKKRLGWFKHEEVLDVAETLGVTPENVLEMENRLNNYDMAFDMSSDDDDDSAYQAPALTLANESPSPELLLEHKTTQQQTQETLMQALNDLDDRSRQIVSRRWLTDNKSTLHELADEFGVSAERIRQIEKNAFNKIKTQFVA